MTRHDDGDVTDLLRALVEEVILLERRRKHRKAPGGGLTRAGAKRVSDPHEWKSQLRTALTSAKGDIDVAAARLKVSPRTLYWHIEQEDAWSVVDAARGASED
jgi:hypothetical protein